MMLQDCHRKICSATVTQSKNMNPARFERTTFWIFQDWNQMLYQLS